MSARFEWAHPAALDDESLLKQCTAGKGRSGGPGGQHRNKVETKVTITHTETGLAGIASERRSAKDNKRVALKRLRLRLATELRTPVPDGRSGANSGEAGGRSPRRGRRPKRRRSARRTSGCRHPTRPALAGGSCATPATATTHRSWPRRWT